MTTLYLIRHGQTANNLKCTFNGAESDQPLNETGLRMAAALTEAFADVPLDAIYSSPIRRAYMTAEGVRGSRDMEIITDPDLAEIYFGKWDGMTFPEIKRCYPDLAKRWIRGDARFRAPSANECSRDVAARVFRAVLRIIRAHRGETVAITSHGFALHMWLTRALGLPIPKYRRIAGLHNTAYGVIEIEDDGHFTVKEWNKRDHYYPDDIPKPHRRVIRIMKKIVGKRHFHPAFKTKKVRQEHAN